MKNTSPGQVRPPGDGLPDTNHYPGRLRAAGTILVCALLTSLFMALSPGTSAAEDQTISQQIQEIKAKSLELNRDLFILEEELLFPDNTQFAVFVSVDVGHFFQLDAVKLSVDGEVVSHYLYTERQLAALHKGGVHRLYLGNLKAGEHEVVAVFNGNGPQGRDYRRASTVMVDKGSGPRHLELKITDAEDLHQPTFTIKEW